MDFLDIAQNRYTTKSYDPSRIIPAEKIEQLKEILRLSPSSINSQPWKFFVVSDKVIKSKLASVSYFNEPKINDASHLVVFSVIGSVEKFEEQIQQNLPEGAVAYYNNFVKPMAEAEIKAWMRQQVYLSIGFFLAACASLGIDSTPMEGIKPEEYDKILGSGDYTSLVAVALGYRNVEDKNQPSLKAKSRLEPEKVLQSI
ncbi:nitroreductase family protein [Lacihabitans soyangensis]|uniref:NAD(P)H-dependent oxidoreductase n=1 Tax=Lacihabitans soyangensis TaxID=869394 RepID=A0AAE3KSP2_9BACT|nr:nitroreductase family protein [Lacihabitans soyangensis]MCP9763567.1 NAD(P)H-dependent oxidoreductase [Lacihabitans soyangensis]